MKLKQNQKRKSSAKVGTKLPHLIHDGFGVRISHHKHSGRHLPLRYTSYSILFFLIAFTSLVVLFAGVATYAYEKVGQGAVSLSGFSKGPPPKNAAEITKPLMSTIYDYNIIAIEGDCERTKFIELFRNSVLAGGTICSEDNRFKLHLTIVPGKNDLQARIHDSLQQYGPDSEIITVWYNVPLPPVTTLLVYTKPIQKGILLGQDLELEYIISGGDYPYAVSVDWGDDTIPYVMIHHKNATYKTKHKYEKAGQYNIIVSVTDQRNSKALFQSVVVVHSDKDTLPPTTTTASCSGASCLSGALKTLDWAWPTLVVAAMMTLSFWLGEKVGVTHRLLWLRLR